MTEQAVENSVKLHKEYYSLLAESLGHVKLMEIRIRDVNKRIRKYFDFSVFTRIFREFNKIKNFIVKMDDVFREKGSTWVPNSQSDIDEFNSCMFMVKSRDQVILKADSEVKIIKFWNKLFIFFYTYKREKEITAKINKARVSLKSHKGKLKTTIENKKLAKNNKTLSSFIVTSNPTKPCRINESNKNREEKLKSEVNKFQPLKSKANITENVKCNANKREISNNSTNIPLKYIPGPSNDVSANLKPADNLAKNFEEFIISSSDSEKEENQRNTKDKNVSSNENIQKVNQNIYLNFN